MRKKALMTVWKRSLFELGEFLSMGSYTLKLLSSPIAIKLERSFKSGFCNAKNILFRPTVNLEIC